MISKTWHHSLLSTTAIGISLVAAYSVVNSNVGNRPVTDFVFPQKIPLPSWEYVGNQTIDVSQIDLAANREVIQSANRYQYRENATQLDIEMYYLTDTRGQIEHLLQEQAHISPETLETQQIKQQNDNYYSIFSDRHRTYLSSCLNPTGESTVTQKQFSENLYQRSLNLKLLSDWLLGKASIRDRRCLWVTISMPNNSSSFLEPTDILEQTWQDWYRWWQPHFPSL